MSVETLGAGPEPIDHFSSAERETALRLALEGIAEIQRRVATKEEQIRREKTEIVPFLDAIRQAEEEIANCRGLLDDLLGYVKEYDPALYAEVKEQINVGG